MKQLILLILLSVAISRSSAFAQQEIVLDPELKITKLSDNVWIVTHCFPWDSNSLVVKASGNDVVLIDTPYTNDATETILQYVKKEINPHKITAIITGFHIDNLGGTGCLLQHKIPVYGSDTTCRLIDERSAQTQQQVMSWLKSPERDKYRQAFANAKFEKPDHVFPIGKGLSLKKGELNFEVFFPGESHSPDNLTVYVKELNVLFGGCMIKSLESPNLGFTGDANMTEWPNSVRKVQEKYTDAKWVIPHHGKWGDRSLLQHTLDLLNNQTK
jgi:glyoxylase-like metal-dependent hydrolase (beta-lactamase superfamily II)